MQRKQRLECGRTEGTGRDMTTDRVVVRDGENVRISEAQLTGLLEVAYKTAAYLALKQLGVEDAAEVEGMGYEVGIGNDLITAIVRLKDGREASASSSMWPDATRAN